MSESDKQTLAWLCRSVAGGFGFVWLFGFAVGYRGWLVPVALGGLVVGCLWLGQKISKMD